MQRDILVVLPDEFTAHQRATSLFGETAWMLLPVSAEDPLLKVFFNGCRIAENFDILLDSTPNTGKDICAETLSLRLVFHLLNLIEKFIAACAQHAALLGQLLR